VNLAHEQPAQPSEYTSYDIARLRAGLLAGELTPSSLGRAFRHRYAEVDQAGPTISSVIEVAPGLGQLAASNLVGPAPLGGVPMLVKDSFDTTDGMRSTSGSLSLVDSGVLVEATVMTRLRAAGALVVGKGNMSEWANFRSSHSSSGWSARGGLTRNPHALDRSAGGSSTGSAAAVAAGLVPASLGTETHGSILCPASMCGVVGVKTTIGRVSTAGLQPIGHSQDTVGPFARTVRDAALVLQVIAGRDRLDPVTNGSPDVPDYLATLNDGVHGLRVGIARSTLWGSDGAADVLAEAAISALSRAGAVIVDDANMASAEELDNIWIGGELDLLLPEFKVNLNRYLSRREGGPRSLDEVIAFNRDHPEQEMHWFGQDVLEAAAATDGLENPAYLAAGKRLRSLGREKGIDGALRRHQVDVLICPTMRPAWKTDLTNGDPSGFESAASAPSIAGYPAVTVPIGLVHLLPVAMTIMGTAWSEPLLLRVATVVEETMGTLPAPAFRPPQPD